MENENHISETEKEELVFLREESRTHKQIFEIILGLFIFIMFQAASEAWVKMREKLEEN